MSSKSSRKKSGARAGAVAVPYPKARPKATIAAKPERGTWLTVAIVVMAVHGVLDTVALLALRKSEYYTIPPWLWALAFLVGVATIVSAAALWYWKRWGLYLYVVASFASMVVGFVVFPLLPVAFYNIIPVAILGWILNSQKKMQYLK